MNRTQLADANYGNQTRRSMRCPSPKNADGSVAKAATGCNQQRGDEECDGSSDQQSPAVSWSENG